MYFAEEKGKLYSTDLFGNFGPVGDNLITARNKRK